MNKMYEIKDVAIRLNRHPRTVRKDIKELQLKFPKESALRTKVGKRLRFTEQQMERIIELCSNQGAE